MSDGKQIPIQSFTRLHLVPRVNGSVSAALVLERTGQEPLAVFLPIEVMAQLLGALPDVIVQTATAPGVAGQPAAKPVLPSVPFTWALESFVMELQPQGATLAMQVKGLSLPFSVPATVLQQLAAALPRPEPLEAIPATPVAVKRALSAKASPVEAGPTQAAPARAETKTRARKSVGVASAAVRASPAPEPAPSGARKRAPVRGKTH